MRDSLEVVVVVPARVGVEAVPAITLAKGLRRTLWGE